MNDEEWEVRTVCKRDFFIKTFPLFVHPMFLLGLFSVTRKKTLRSCRSR